MTTTTCNVVHDQLTTRYCPQCGKKLEQPIADLRAHILSQITKARVKKNQKSELKWASWLEALDFLIDKAETVVPTTATIATSP